MNLYVFSGEWEARPCGGEGGARPLVRPEWSKEGCEAIGRARLGLTLLYISVWYIWQTLTKHNDFPLFLYCNVTYNLVRPMFFWNECGRVVTAVKQLRFEPSWWKMKPSNANEYKQHLHFSILDIYMFSVWKRIVQHLLYWMR